MMKSTTEWTGPAIAALVVVAVVTVGGSSAARTATASERPEGVELRPRVDADDVLLRVSLRPDGSAIWQVEYRIRLDDANATEAFEELRRDVRANESAYLGQFSTRIRDTVSTAENRTGREMAASNFTVSTDRRQLPQEYGVVTYSFEWRGFARTDGSKLRVGDALAGLFLDAETTLLVAWPDGYAVSTVAPTPDETRPQAVVWVGPTDFSSGEPTLVLAPATEITDETRTTTPLETTESQTTAVGRPSDNGGDGLPAAVFGGLLLALAVGGALAVRRRGTDGRPTTDDELLTNEERVLALLEANDGRVKQQRLVEELGWSEAKASRVVNRLSEESRIEVVRLGRENVLSLSDDTT